MTEAATLPADLEGLLGDPSCQDLLRTAIQGILDGPIAGEPPRNERRLSYRALGRLVSRIDRSKTNEEKGRLVALALVLDDKTTTDDEALCVWTEHRFSDLDHLAELAETATTDYEFATFLCGCKVPSDIQDLEQRIQQNLGPLAEHFEPLKTELNRTLGAILIERWSDAPAPTFDSPDAMGRTVDFDRADLVILVDPYYDQVELSASNLYLAGNYNKFDRTIPQTKWPCRSCKGDGCERCGFTGQQYQTSVEAQVAERAVVAFDAKDESFHGMGREDIDALMLGTGRPFVLELKEPRLRLPRADPHDPSSRIDLDRLLSIINEHAAPEVQITGLRPVPKSEVADIKESASDKRYRAHVIAETAIARSALDEAIATVIAQPIAQDTPDRVKHRRADKTRKRSVRSVEVLAFNAHARDAQETLTEEQASYSMVPPTDPDDKPMDETRSTHFTVEILAESGTYIKELVHSDEGRTQPSFAGLLGVPMRVVALDVIGMQERAAPPTE